MSLNVFTGALRNLCRDRPIDEKWLIAPSRRVGFQWIDAVTRSGRPVLNVRVKTLHHFALDLASPEMTRRGVRFLRGLKAEVLIGAIFERLRRAGGGYLTQFASSPGLTAAIHSTIRDLRMSGVKAADIDESDFEVETKGREIRTLLAEYEKELQARNLADYADLLQMAAESMSRYGSTFLGDTLLLLPRHMEQALRGLAGALWRSVPEKNRHILEEDGYRDDNEVPETDAGLLRWLSKPAEAPACKRDGTAAIFRALGEVNEVREVLRRCLAENVAFDEVEILHTDSDTYVPLIYETAWRLAPDDAESIPVTFEEGVPLRYSRPGRCLKAWLSWLAEDYPQSTLVRMIQDGLLRLETAGEAGFSFMRSAAMLRAVPIGSGKDRYLDMIDGSLRSLEETAAGKVACHEDDDSDKPDLSGLFKRIEGLKAIRALVSELLDHVPAPDDYKSLLSHASWFLTAMVRPVNRFDEYSRSMLQKEIGELAECLDDELTVEGLNVRDWLANLPSSTGVGGQGPRPGCLYVAPVSGGGHSGRKYTFILGLDDGRFPSVGLQDPLLLDRERGRVSEELPTAAERLAAKLHDFEKLAARLRGKVTLSYSSRSLTDDREMFPSPVVLAAFRILSGMPDGDQEALVKWLPYRASFAPEIAEHCIDASEWWLWRLCGDEAVADPEAAIAENFPHLGRGRLALKARESDLFTEYDGYVPEAGRDFDPRALQGPVLSASRMELLGTCPLQYFFRHVLGITVPEEFTIDPFAWLDALQRGTLLHSVFREFMARLREDDLLPDFHRDMELLEDVLQRGIDFWRNEIPPANEEVFQVTVTELRRTVRVFLQEEAIFCAGSTPFCFEASIGMPSDGPGTPLDMSEPVEISLPDGTSIRARGRVDRIDEENGSSGKRFTIWDYKTGSSWGYDQRDPFRNGRKVQSVLYRLLTEKQLKQRVSGDAMITGFGYFFPTIRQHGDRIFWSSPQLDHGTEVLQSLVEMMAGGCFPFTDDPADVTYSEYLPAFGEVATAANAIKLKLENVNNDALSRFRKIRGY